MRTGRIITALATMLALPVMAADAPGYFKVPGTDTTLKIYGKAETWGYYTMDGGPGDAVKDPSGNIIGFQNEDFVQ